MSSTRALRYQYWCQRDQSLCALVQLLGRAAAVPEAKSPLSFTPPVEGNQPKRKIMGPSRSKASLCNHRAGLARYLPWLTNHQRCDLEKSAFGDRPTYQGNTLSHEAGKGQWTASESQGANGLIPETQRDLSLLPGDSTNILRSKGKDSGKEGDLNWRGKTVSLEAFQD
ncbi:hypothetical protein GRJ2_001686900 [Grus japonensis]|uniref:Uncharacterized protein n=1 Tax=Grus japonensis TaxID=30415 RepID=A0ABC9X446_GRUJA